MTKTLNVRVENVGNELILALDDGTFLIEIEDGVLIRVDKDFNTKSQLINNKYFILEYKLVGTLFMADQLTGKNYSSDKIQEAFDDLYKYFVSIKVKGGK